MGTEITLNIAGVAVTYSKNHRGFDHGSIFQEQDRMPLKCDQINYEWYEEHGEDPTPAEMAFCRTLMKTVPRIELLGFNLHRAKIEYEAFANKWLEEKQHLDDDCTQASPALMSFEEFRSFVITHPLDSLDNTFIIEGKLDQLASIRSHFTTQQLERIPYYEYYNDDAYSERDFFVSLMRFLHPYSMLRILAEAPENADARLVWQYGPLVNAGWATEIEFSPNAKRTETFLVVTEGSSDVYILKHAFKLLRPEIADFFRFIDVSESHPFSGTGNLVKFAEGLVKIDVQNQIIFVFDNDAEGLDAQQRLSGLNLPINMRGVMLPELDDFREFTAQGPQGLHSADINRRAAAIECYLDLKTGNQPLARVLWTTYKRNLGIYQGSLENKESYSKIFLKLTPDTLKMEEYDTSKILAVLRLLIAECTAIAMEQWDIEKLSTIEVY